MKDETHEQSSSQNENIKRMALVTLSAGCLTFVVAGLALGGGLLLDSRLETFPRWTLILMAGSVPFTLGGVYWIVRWTMKRIKDSGERGNEEEGSE